MTGTREHRPAGDRRGDPPAALDSSSASGRHRSASAAPHRARRAGGRRRHARSGLDDGEVETVRLIGVDTPETVKPDTPVQCFGPQASAFEHRHTSKGSRVRLLVGVEPRDDYGRLLAYVWIRDLAALASSRSSCSAAASPARSPFIQTIVSRDRFEKLEPNRLKRGKGLWNACWAGSSIGRS